MQKSGLETLRRMARLFLAIILPVALTHTASAAQRDLGFGHFVHTELEAKNGLPAQANSIVQTPDGYLWFGTPDGLFRYNGQTFERIPVLRHGAFTDAAIIEAIVTRRGEMWLGAGQNAGVLVLRNGRLQQTGMTTPPPQITHLVEGKDGSIWAASSGRKDRLFRHMAGKWQRMDLPLALPAGAIADMEVDRRGTIWILLASASGGQLAFLRQGSARFETAADRVGLGRMTLDPNGGLWVSDNFGTRMVRDSSGARPLAQIAYPPVANIGFPKIKFDSRGNIWGSSLSGGIFLISGAGKAENSGKKPLALSYDDRIGTLPTLDVFPDREGNVWISSSESLHRFHPANAVPVSSIQSHPRSPQRLAVATDGSIYLFSLGSLYRIEPNAEPALVVSNLDANAVICTARSGGVWYIDRRKAMLFDGGQRHALPAALPASEPPVLCEEDGFGRLWSLSRNAVSWFREGSWHYGFPGFDEADIWDVATEASGALIVSLGTNRLIRIDETVATPVRTGWDGSISSMHNTPLGLLVSHSNGLWRSGTSGQRSGASITTRALAKARDFDVDHKYLWVFGLSGVKQFPLARLNQTWDTERRPTASMTFDWAEGLPVGKQDIGFRGRQIAAGSDGRIWVLTRSGPYLIDTRNVIRNTIPPPLAIEAVWGDGHPASEKEGRQYLSSGTRSVRISYGALSYSMPERVRFKYRLIGANDEWTYAGNRHEVTFDNLGPGDYRFEVMGANEDGVWNTEPASIEFTIAPTFLQSPIVKFVAALLLLTAIALAYHWRTYILTTRVRNAMSVRSAERERIARELHDTLLQSVQGLILRFQLLVDHLPKEHPSRAELATTLDQADEVLSEGRKRVLDLRSRQPRTSLEEVIEAVVERQLPTDRFQTHIRTSGVIRPIETPVFNSLIDVANECLFNILRHAKADRVQIDLRYGPSYLEMEIADNGVGFSPKAIADAAAAGHFGILGMRERIEALGGTLQINSEPAKGVRITVRFSSTVAYLSKNGQTPKKTGRGWPWFTRKVREQADP
ncbi:MAG: hypothetical protein BGO57_03195 [Sphingomonadales bacterium 63-6]|nr:MAG: hypothetical protein BGO57_03195 [Sphingomonadales bacterium 63-6]